MAASIITMEIEQQGNNFRKGSKGGAVKLQANKIMWPLYILPEVDTEVGRKFLANKESKLLTQCG